MLNFFKDLVGSMIEARQRSVNIEVARMLKTEYPNETPEYLEFMLNNKLYGARK